MSVKRVDGLGFPLTIPGHVLIIVPNTDLRGLVK
jgi:hypothetical protein